MRHALLALLWAATTLFAPETHSQSSNKEMLDTYVQLMEDNNTFMGTVLLYQHHKKVFARHVGYSSVKAGMKPHDRTMYRLGSVSKTITALLVLKAIESGKISFTDNIRRFFPSINHAERITIRHLLNHHSGIHNFTSDDFDKTQPKSRADLIASIARAGTDFTPGSKGSYSNSNYVLLSFILEDVYRKPYARIVRDEITKPLRLHHFQLGDQGITKNNKAVSYEFQAGWNDATETHLSVPMGAGAIVSSAEDLATVLAAMFRGKLISRPLLQEMVSLSNGYGLGIFQKEIAGETAYTHDGVIDGFNSYFYYFPKDGTLYVLLSNAQNYHLEIVNHSILSIAFNKPFQLPQFHTYQAASDDLNQFSGIYSSDSISMTINIWNKNKLLLAQPGGQEIYTLHRTGQNKFFHEKTGVTLEFVPAEKQMIMTQGQQTIVFRKP